MYNQVPNYLFNNSILLYISVMNLTILCINFFEELRFTRRVLKIDESLYSTEEKNSIIKLITNNFSYYIFQYSLLLALSFFILFLVL